MPDREIGSTDDDRRPPVRIIVADDDADMRHLVASGLRRDGHAVVEAEDGAELMHHAIPLPGMPRPQVIVCDIRMPRMSGLQVLALLHETNQRIPALVISAHLDVLTNAEAIRLGAVATFKKPLDLYELRATVWRMTENPSGGS
jgi:DNA-binding NtrC family response regulator